MFDIFLGLVDIFSGLFGFFSEFISLNLLKKGGETINKEEKK